MPPPAPAFPSALSVLACRYAFTLVRSMSDGAWASHDELTQATGLNASTVASGLTDLEANGFVERSQDRYRLNRHTVRQVLTAAAEVA